MGTANSVQRRFDKAVVEVLKELALSDSDLLERKMPAQILANIRQSPRLTYVLPDDNVAADAKIDDSLKRLHHTGRITFTEVTRENSEYKLWTISLPESLPNTKC